MKKYDDNMNCEVWKTKKKKKKKEYADMCSYGNGFLNNNDMYPIDLKKKKMKVFIWTPLNFGEC